MANEVTTQIVREAEPIEQAKLQLMQAAANLKPTALPAYQVAGFSPEQIQAIKYGVQGIGAYQPYLAGAASKVGAGAGLAQEGANILRGADTRNQFDFARQAMAQSGQAAGQMGQYAGQAGAGLGYLGAAGSELAQAQQMAMGAQPQFGEAQNYLRGGAGAAMGAAYQPGFGRAESTLAQGIGALGGAAQGFDPRTGAVKNFMNPFQQQVIDESIRQINRQGDISRQNLQAQAVKAGAFGGSREGIQRAELERALSEQRNAAITGTLSQGYNQAQQAAQQAFEQQQQRQLAQAQGLQGAAGLGGQLASQQGALGMQAAGQMSQAGAQLGSLEAQRAQQGLGSASLYGQLAGQRAGLAGQYAGIAGQQAGILGQQAQLQQGLGQGLGNLAGQQFGIGQAMGQGIGSLGTQLGNLGMQQAALGQTGQQMGQQDVNFLFNLGAEQQKQQQAALDAYRATAMQTAYQPMQQLAFISDIYKGAPSSQMAMTSQMAPTPSPFQQIAGLGIGALSAGAAANKAGIL